MNIEKIFNDFTARVEAEHLSLEAVAIADGSKILFEKHYIPDAPRNIHSHTKSFMSTAVGLAIDEGKLSLDDTLAGAFPEYVPENPDPRLLKIRLRDLLTMSSGWDSEYLMNAMRREGIGYPDYMAYMLSRPMKLEPGTSFHYSTADSIMAGRMVEQAVGQTLGRYLYDRLFSKLGMGWPSWETDPQGHHIGGAGMLLTLGNMLKLGQLFLNDGVWNGERIVSSEWVKEATTKKIDTDPGDLWSHGYGYQWWMSPYGSHSYRADGAFGQVTTVLPDAGLVVAVQHPSGEGFVESTRQVLHEMVLTQL